jgi:SapC
MARHVLLNNIDHRGLRVDSTRSAALGDNLMLALTYPGEFRNVQAHYPIVFHKGPDGRFQPVALFGFREGENLFLRDSRWHAHYIPLSVERQPFLIGRDGAGEPVIHIDMDSPRVGASTGEALFLEHGGTTDFLERMASVLQTLHEGIASTPAFVDALLKNNLLESFVLDVELDGGTQHRLAGFYTIHEEHLRALDGDALREMHRAGHLEAAHMAVASLSNLRQLIEWMKSVDAADR